MSGGKILLDVAIEWMVYVHLMIQCAQITYASASVTAALVSDTSLSNFFFLISSVS